MPISVALYEHALSTALITLSFDYIEDRLLVLFSHKLATSKSGPHYYIVKK